MHVRRPDEAVCAKEAPMPAEEQSIGDKSQTRFMLEQVLNKHLSTAEKQQRVVDSMEALDKADKLHHMLSTHQALYIRAAVLLKYYSFNDFKIHPFPKRGPAVTELEAQILVECHDREECLHLLSDIILVRKVCEDQQRVQAGLASIKSRDQKQSHTIYCLWATTLTLAGLSFFVLVFVLPQFKLNTGGLHIVPGILFIASFLGYFLSRLLNTGAVPTITDIRSAIMAQLQQGLHYNHKHIVAVLKQELLNPNIALLAEKLEYVFETNGIRPNPGIMIEGRDPTLDPQMSISAVRNALYFVHNKCTAELDHRRLPGWIYDITKFLTHFSLLFGTLSLFFVLWVHQGPEPMPKWCMNAVVSTCVLVSGITVWIILCWVDKLQIARYRTMAKNLAKRSNDIELC